MIFMTQLTLGRNLFKGGKSAEFKPFSTVSQVNKALNLRIMPDLFIWIFYTESIRKFLTIIENLGNLDRNIIFNFRIF